MSFHEDEVNMDMIAEWTNQYLDVIKYQKLILELIEIADAEKKKNIYN